MNTTKTMAVAIFEQPGNLSASKMSQLARLIESYAKAHPELIEQPETETKEAKSA